ncbi:MAG TPA: uroporphyrinogen decarboxylase family protein [Ruminiclostridium sp.]
MNNKERFIAVINGMESDKVPVFPLLMSFSAKRYGVSYRQFASNGHILAESQLKVKEMFKIDAITACSDAFRVSADLGGDIVFPEDKPPYIARHLVKDENDFKHLKKPDVTNPKGRMADRIMGTSEMVKAIGDKCMVLGWVDMPFAEACSVCGVSEFMMMLYDEPELAHKLLDFLTDIVIEFAVAQVEVGSPMIGAGDATASLISPELYREFALPYEKRVCEAVHKAGGLVKLHICGNTVNLLESLVLSGADLFNVDHLVDLSLAINNYGKAGKAFKGNINPVEDMLFATPAECQSKALKCIQRAKGTRYILSAGCEVPADVTDEVFRAFCEAPDLIL